MSTKIAPRNTDETAAFLRRQHEIGSSSWRALCLSLQRQARGLPGVYPTAASAREATPQSERVYKVADLRRGMVGYSQGSNPAGHIFFIIGWRGPKSDPSNCLTWTNDRRPGHVDVVPLTFYKSAWGQNFNFGATWLNGYDFSEFNAKPKPPPEPVLGARYDRSMDILRDVIQHHRKEGHDRLVVLLQRDLERMKRRRARFS